MNDFRDVSGIASFVMYLLMIASKRDPEASGFERFVETNGGDIRVAARKDCSAFSYHLNSAHFASSLDRHVRSLENTLHKQYRNLLLVFHSFRFANFFIEPTLSYAWSETVIDHTVRFLQSNHLERAKSDDFRIIQVEKLISKQNHAYNNLSSGT